MCCDASPKLTGELFIDQMEGSNLNMHVLSVCQKNLKTGGKALVKAFESPHERELLDAYNMNFKRIRRLKTTVEEVKEGNSSSEMYILAEGYGMSEHPLVVQMKRERAKLAEIRT